LCEKVGAQGEKNNERSRGQTANKGATQ